MASSKPQATCDCLHSGEQLISYMYMHCTYCINPIWRSLACVNHTCTYNTLVATYLCTLVSSPLLPSGPLSPHPPSPLTLSPHPILSTHPSQLNAHLSFQCSSLSSMVLRFSSRGQNHKFPVGPPQDSLEEHRVYLLHRTFSPNRVSYGVGVGVGGGVPWDPSPPPQDLNAEY